MEDQEPPSIPIELIGGPKDGVTALLALVIDEPEWKLPQWVQVQGSFYEAQPPFNRRGNLPYVYQPPLDELLAAE